NGTHAHTTSPGSASPSMSGVYSIVTIPSDGSGWRRRDGRTRSTTLRAVRAPRAATCFALRPRPLPPCSTEPAYDVGCGGVVAWSDGHTATVHAPPPPPIG